MRKIRLVSLLLAVFLLLSAAPKSVGSQEGSITVGLTTRTGTTGLPFAIAEEKGFFKSEGLNGLVVVMQNQVVVNGVVTRNIDYGGEGTICSNASIQSTTQR